MGTQARSSRRSPSPASVTMEPIEKVLSRQREREEKARASLNRKADSIVEDSGRRLRDLVGRKKYDALRAAIRNERNTLHALRQPPEGLKRNLEQDRRACKRRVDALLRKHGVSLSKVKRIQNDTGERLAKLLAPAGNNSGVGYSLANHHDKWRHLTGLTNAVSVIAPPGDDPNDPYRWFWFTPPYSDCWHTGNADPERFVLNWDFFCTPGGWIGTELILDRSDAGFGDVAWGVTDSAVVLMFDAPIAGLLEVVIRAQCLRDLYEVSMVDEFGLSWARVYQESRLFLYVPARDGVRHTAPMSCLETTSDDPPRNSDLLIPGHHYFAVLMTQAPVLKASDAGPTKIYIGSRGFTRAFTDDVTVHTKSLFMWQIVSVGVRIRP